MGDNTPAVSTGSQDPATPAAPGSAAAPDTSVGTGEVVPKERFDGLMSASQKREAELKAEIDRLKAAQAPAPAPAAPAPAAPTVDVDAIMASVNEAKQETATVFKLYKGQKVADILKRYPNATADAVKGATEDEWEASAKAEHDRVTKLIEDKTAAATAEARASVAKEFGVPLSVLSPAAPAGKTREEAHKEAYEAAVKAGDTKEAARLLLTSPIEAV